jgi:hypothetical protein
VRLPVGAAYLVHLVGVESIEPTMSMVWLQSGPLCFKNVDVLGIGASWRLVVEVCYSLFSLLG